jgi:Xaa-Pro dipeptidase
MTGLPSDALLFLFREGYSVLLPWDVQLAEQLSAQDAVFADRTVPYNNYKRLLTKAVPAFLEEKSCAGGRVEVGEAMPFPLYKEIAKQIGGELVCRTEGISSYVRGLRSIKDEAEQKIIRRAAYTTDSLISALESNLTESVLESEIDVACFIEREALKRGAEGLGFETLVAGPNRSFAIHPFPSYTAGPFIKGGLSLIDFGIVLDGYTTDVTVPIIRGDASAGGQALIELIRGVWDIIIPLLKPGVSTLALCREVDAYFESHSRSMPHALGHGIGLDAHEKPILRNREDSDTVLEPGMVLAVEPGLYEKEAGGCRLENDILITEDGPEVLTSSRILYIPGPG